MRSCVSIEPSRPEAGPDPRRTVHPGHGMQILVVSADSLCRAAIANIVATRQDVEALDAVESLDEAADRLARAAYDVAVVDVAGQELPETELARIRPLGQPAFVLMTSVVEHALAAFELGFADCILRPFGEDRLQQAIDTAFQKSANEHAARVLRGLAERNEASATRASKIAIKTKGRILLVDPSEVFAVEAEGNYVMLRRPSGSEMLRESISVAAEKLKPYGFVRVHRSLLINASHVEEIQPCLTGDYVLRVRGGREYIASRNYKKNLRDVAGCWIGSNGFAE